jgi:outer membrane immunogenic protein
MFPNARGATGNHFGVAVTDQGIRDMKSHWLGAAIVGAIIQMTISGAFAADLPASPVYAKGPAYVSAPSWTGFYVGANAGYGWDRPSASFSGTPNIAIEFTGGVLPTSLSPDPKGWLAGAQLGYNWQFAPAWVAGLETDLSGTGINGTTSVSPTNAQFPNLFTTTVSANTKWLGTVRPRLGYLPVNNTLIYVTGGLAYGETEVSFNTVQFAPNSDCTVGLRCANGSVSGVKMGWTVGAGVESMIASNWTVKAEYLFVDLGTQSVTAPTLDMPTGIVTLTTSRHFMENIFRAGVNYKFGG